MNIKKLLCLVAYYGFARYLPASTSPMTHWARRIRRMICRPIFDKCGDNVNVECGARFATGGGISIGSGSGLGVNCSVHGPITIGDNVILTLPFLLKRITSNVQIFRWDSKE